MPHLISVDRIHDCLLVKWRGEFSMGERLAYMKTLQAMDPADTARCRFHDARRAVMDVAVEEVQAAARVPKPEEDMAEEAILSAILVSSELSFGMMRVFETLSSRPGLRTRVFRDLEEAKQWLGVKMPGDPFEALGEPE